ncbi:TolB family protein [Nocardioides astragali]|uniref:TolB family protein n=1 Tax=Nocardioides astragali TaxID=1776736 RepID=A0ABW2N2X3_9ACTN|nr:hypothetical protein [Nocardioides astragali]
MSTADNLVSRDSRRQQVYVRDRELGVTTRASVSSSERPADQHSWLEDMSADGRYVLFTSRTTYLVQHDTNQALDLFMRDTVKGKTTRVSVGSGGRQANDHTLEGNISGNGKWVVFSCLATNLAPGASNPGQAQVFMRNLDTGQTILVSRNSRGEPASGEGASNASVSANGRL